MLLPYASDNPPTQKPVVTPVLLLLLCSLTLWVVAAEAHHPGDGHTLLMLFGIVPARFRVYSPLTYLFFHGGFGHLLLNAFYLWIFGAGVEAAVGRGRFLLLFLGAGIVGGLLQWLVTAALFPLNGGEPIVGASAACAGLVGIYAVRYYRARLSFIGLPFAPHVVTVVILFLCFEGGMGVWGLAQGSTAEGVAHWAHFGGFVFGLGTAQLLRLGETGQRAYLTADAHQATEKSLPGMAIRRWEDLLGSEPNNAQAMTELGRAWLQLGDTEQSSDYYLRALSHYLKHGNREEAAACFFEMRAGGVHRLPSNPGDMFSLGNALEEQERYAEAAELFRMITVTYPNSPETEAALLKTISFYIYQLDRKEEASLLLRIYSDRYPNSAFLPMADRLRRATLEIQP